ncbi:MAG TPA: hypothetical protein VGB42_04510 [Candidatus Thermoplasmatota archaeon]
MGRASGERGGRWGAWLTPTRVARLVTFAVAAACVAVGAVGLTAKGPEGAVPAAGIAAAGDGPVHATGTVERTWVDGGASVTHVTLRGAGDVDIQVAGAGWPPFGPGSFVEVRGMKDGTVLLASSITAGVDPVDRAAPWLGLAAVLVSALAVAPLSGAARGAAAHAGGPTLLWRMAAPLRRRRPADEEAPPAPPAR